MPNLTLKNARSIDAYVVGSVLTFYGVAWFLVQLGTQIKRGNQMPFSTHSTGYWLAGLCAAGGVLTCLAVLRGMPDPTACKVRRITAYLIGSVLICVGAMGFLIELGKGMPSSRNFIGYVDAVVLVAFGVLACIAVRLHYGGGYWSLLGLLLVVAGTLRIVAILQAEIRGSHWIIPAASYSTATSLCAVGLYCLSWGHLRRHRPKKN